MKTRETTPGKTYSVHTSSGCTVSDKNGWSKTIDAPDGYFTAHAGEVTIDGDDAADIREVFKLAPQQRLAILGVLGGNGGLPAGYKRVEYIEFAGRQNLTFNKVFGLGFVQTADIMITQKPLTRVLMQSSDNEWWAVGADLSLYCAMSKVAQGIVGEKYNILYEFLEDRTQSLTVNGTKGVYTKDHGNFPTGNEIRNFQINSKGYFGTASDFYARLYNLSLSCPRHGIKMKMIPCLDEVGAPCMYDLVSRKPFYNEGEGDFLYPTERATYSLRRVLPDWGKLTEHGLSRLYHAPANYNGELIDYALEHGYKPIIEPEMPEEGYWTPRWTETEDEIVLEWVETEPPADEFGLPEENLT